MKSPAQENEEAKFAMAPMIDMVFLLLVFFMCSAHLHSQQVSLPLTIPSASKGVVPKERPDRWTINIDSNGVIYADGEPLGDADKAPDELKKRAAEELKRNPRLKAYLRADVDTRHKAVRTAMQAVASAGIDDFIFGVYTAETAPEVAAP